MNYTELQCLSRRKFKRRFGVEKKTFKRMKLAIEEQMPQFKKRGCPRKLGIEEQIPDFSSTLPQSKKKIWFTLQFVSSHLQSRTSSLCLKSSDNIII